LLELFFGDCDQASEHGCGSPAELVIALVEF